MAKHLDMPQTLYQKASREEVSETETITRDNAAVVVRLVAVVSWGAAQFCVPLAIPNPNTSSKMGDS